jgi:LPXTG-motif cell wall-anchored protein
MPTAQYDTSNGNWYKNNRLGFHPSGVKQPNGTDFSWDEQGVGNCWQGNVSSTGTVTDDTTVIPLPNCASGGSLSPVGNAAKTASNAPCAEYNREDNNHPPGCTWFDSPTKPAARQDAPGETPVEAVLTDAAPPAAAPPAANAGLTLPTTGVSVLPGVVGLLLAGVVLVLHRRRRVA